MTNRHIARRTLLSGLAVGAGLGASLSSSPAGARAGTDMEISSEGHLAQKGDVKLAMYRKWAGKVGGWSAKPLPVLFLVHGSSLSSRSSFDLAFRDSTYSVMDVFAGYGFDVWTMDHEGFGRSDRTAGTSDIASRVEDLKAAMTVVQRVSGPSKVHVFGESSGAIAAAAFAQSEPDRVDRLILAATTYKGEGAAEIQRRRDRIAELRANPQRKRDAAMIRSIFTRDGHPNLYKPTMVDARQRAERNVCGHGGQPAAGGSEKSALARPDDARRMGRQFQRR